MSDDTLPQLESLPDLLKKQSGEEAIYCSAFHEAGHALIGHLLGKRILSVDLTSDGKGKYGGCRFADSDLDWDIVDFVSIACAGGRAESKLCRLKDWPDYALEGSYFDLQTARERTIHLGANDQKAIFDASLSRVDELLDEHWVIIKSLAEMFMRQEVTDEQQINEVFSTLLGS